MWEGAWILLDGTLVPIHVSLREGTKDALNIERGTPGIGSAMYQGFVFRSSWLTCNCSRNLPQHLFQVTLLSKRSVLFVMSR